MTQKDLTVRIQITPIIRAFHNQVDFICSATEFKLEFGTNYGSVVLLLLLLLPEEPARPQRGLEDLGDLVDRLLGGDLLKVGAAKVGARLEAGVHGDLPLPPHVRLGPDQHDGEVGAVLAELESGKMRERVDYQYQPMYLPSNLSGDKIRLNFTLNLTARGGAKYQISTIKTLLFSNTPKFDT